MEKNITLEIKLTKDWCDIKNFNDIRICKRVDGEILSVIGFEFKDKAQLIKDITRYIKNENLEII